MSDRTLMYFEMNYQFNDNYVLLCCFKNHTFHGCLIWKLKCALKKFCIIYLMLELLANLLFGIRQKWTFIAIKDIKLSEQLYSKIF